MCVRNAIVLLSFFDSVPAYPYAVADASLDKVKELFDVNFFAAWAMTQAFLPLLMASEHPRVVNMGSIAGLMPVPFGAAYNCSKAALHALGDTMRVELAPFRYGHPESSDYS